MCPLSLRWNGKRCNLGFAKCNCWTAPKWRVYIWHYNIITKHRWGQEGALWCHKMPLNALKWLWILDLSEKLNVFIVMEYLYIVIFLFFTVVKNLNASSTTVYHTETKIDDYVELYFVLPLVHLINQPLTAYKHHCIYALQINIFYLYSVLCFLYQCETCDCVHMRTWFLSSQSPFH